MYELVDVDEARVTSVATELSKRGFFSFQTDDEQGAVYAGVTILASARMDEYFDLVSNDEPDTYDHDRTTQSMYAATLNLIKRLAQDAGSHSAFLVFLALQGFMLRRASDGKVYTNAALFPDRRTRVGTEYAPRSLVSHLVAQDPAPAPPIPSISDAVDDDHAPRAPVRQAPTRRVTWARTDLQPLPPLPQPVPLQFAPLPFYEQMVQPNWHTPPINQGPGQGPMMVVIDGATFVAYPAAAPPHPAPHPHPHPHPVPYMYPYPLHTRAPVEW